MSDSIERAAAQESVTSAGGAATAPAAGSPRLHAGISIRWSDVALYAGFVLVFLFFAITLQDRGFLSLQNFTSVTSQVTPIALMAFGLVFVLTTGEIDLSVGSVVGLAALVTALGLRHYGVPAGIAFGLLTGVLCGLLNGVLIVVLRVPSFLITLGTMQLYYGLAQLSTNLQDVPILNETYTTVFGSGYIGPVSATVVWLIFGFIFAHVAYRNLSFGWRVMATGSNRSSARALGINTGRVRISVMVISSCCGALAGMIYAGQLHGAVYTLGSSDLLIVISAVVIGGTSLFGGTGSMVGALLGALLMTIITNGLILMGATVQEQIVVTGIIIVIAVAISQRQPAE